MTSPAHSHLTVTNLSATSQPDTDLNSLEISIEAQIASLQEELTRIRLLKSSNQPSVAETVPSCTTQISSTDPSPSHQYLISPQTHEPTLIRVQIALQFSYSGNAFCGLSLTLPPSPPGVENHLVKAFAKERLIEVVWKDGEDGREEDWQRTMDRCGWEKCGRTDTGVSSSGQVVSLWIWCRTKKASKGRRNDRRIEEDGEKVPLEPLHLPYPLLLMKHLPSTIVPLVYSVLPSTPAHPVLDNPASPLLAPEPHSPSSDLQNPPNSPNHFSARHNCLSRHYIYFFPIRTPPPSSRYSSCSTLSVPLMQTAASFLVGTHDFRNFCAMNPSAQLKNCIRTIYSAEIVPIGEIFPSPSALSELESTGMHCLSLRGRGFLYHQVRCIMALLFLVGSQLEEPEVIKKLMFTPHTTLAEDWEVEEEGKREGWERVESRPMYVMAPAEGLNLWNCEFPTLERDDLAMIGEGSAMSNLNTGIVRWQKSEVPAHDSKALASERKLYLSHLSSLQSQQNSLLLQLSHSALNIHNLQTHFLAHHSSSDRYSFSREERGKKGYTSILKLKRGDGLEELNEKWKKGKGIKFEERGRIRREAKEATASRNGDE